MWFERKQPSIHPMPRHDQTSFPSWHVFTFRRAQNPEPAATNHLQINRINSLVIYTEAHRGVRVGKDRSAREEKVSQCGIQRRWWIHSFLVLSFLAKPYIVMAEKMHLCALQISCSNDEKVSRGKMLLQFLS